MPVDANSGRDKVDLLIVVPPFATTSLPMLGPSLLLAQCMAAGISGKVVYSNLHLASILGFSLYERIGLSSFTLMLGELVFRHLAFDGADPSVAIESFFASHDRLETSSALGSISRDEALVALNSVDRFVKEEAQRLLSYEPRIVGFSTVFQQNLSSIALARELRRLRPDLLVVVGGANTAEPMGSELARIADCFDVVFSGEADIAFPDFAAKALGARGTNGAGKVVHCPQVRDLDSVSEPNFEDYFQQLRQWPLTSPSPGQLGRMLPLEASRGCWWGEKHHCAFCGLNGAEMAFRTKSPDRIVREIANGKINYRVDTFQATDNIMSNKFRTSVLPALEKLQPLDLFFEVKSNVKEEDLDQFVMSGVNTIQPGIESFSSAVLKKIDKGVTGARNVWLLRECASRRIRVVWNLLVDVPGDKENDYAIQTELVPKLTHLEPPRGLSRIVIDRFSPYFDRPDAFGISNLQALPAYAALYPSRTLLGTIAYHFQGEYSSAYRSSPDCREQLEQQVERWRLRWRANEQPAKLYSVAVDSHRLFIEDTRDIAISQRLVLDLNESECLRSFRRPRKIVDSDRGRELSNLFTRNFLVEIDGLAVSIVAEPEIGFTLQKLMRGRTAQASA